MIKLFICAPKINQSVKIATEKIKEIFQLFPLLEQEVINGGNFSKDYVRLIFRNGSIFDVVSTQESQRGGRRNAKQIWRFKIAELSGKPKCQTYGNPNRRPAMVRGNA